MRSLVVCVVRARAVCTQQQAGGGQGRVWAVCAATVCSLWHSTISGCVCMCVYALCVYVVQSNYVCRRCRRHTARHRHASAAAAAAGLLSARCIPCWRVVLRWPLCLTQALLWGCKGSAYNTASCEFREGSCCCARLMLAGRDGSHFKPESQSTAAATAALGRWQQQQQQGQQRVSPRLHCSSCSS